jgi:hypothetical protein
VLIPSSILAQLEVRKPTDVIGACIHHTVTLKTVTAEQIAAMEPFTTIGYNCLIRKTDDTVSGMWEIQEGRPALYVPAAQYGLNVEYYAIAVAGQYQPDAASWTDEVEEGALDLIVQRIHQLREHYGGTMPLQYLIGHRDVATIKARAGGNPADFSTLCPGDRLAARLDDLRIRTGLRSPLSQPSPSPIPTRTAKEAA